MADENNALEDNEGYNKNVADALRNQTGKIIDTISGIEEKTASLEAAFDAKLKVITQEKVKVVFSGMTVVSEESLLPLEEDKTSTLCVYGDDENFITGYRLNQEAGRLVLGLTLGGAGFSVDNLGRGDLMLSEIKLLGVIVDEIVEGFFDCIDVSTDRGTPRPPVLAVKQEFAELANERDLIAFTFGVSLDQHAASFELIVPLDIFEDEVADKAAQGQQNAKKREEEIWTERLSQRVEEVPLTHIVEVGNCETPLTRLASLCVGETLDIKIRTENVRVLDESGAPSFLGTVFMNDAEIKLQVTDSESVERG